MTKGLRRHQATSSLKGLGPVDMEGLVVDWGERPNHARRGMTAKTTRTTGPLCKRIQ